MVTLDLDLFVQGGLGEGHHPLNKGQLIRFRDEAVLPTNDG